MNERELLVDCLRRLNRIGVIYYLTGGEQLLVRSSNHPRFGLCRAAVPTWHQPRLPPGPSAERTGPISPSLPIDSRRRGAERKKMTRATRQRLRWMAHFAGLTTLALTVSTFGASAPPKKHFVWRVTNLPVPFYLVGSFHSLTKDNYPLPEAYRGALAQAQRLLFEYDPRRRDALTRRFQEAA